MAVHHLLVHDSGEVRSKPGVTDDVAKHDERLQGKIHFGGGGTVESHVLGGYVKLIRKNHLDAGLPAVYASDKILDDADKMRTRLGDGPFFETLNGASSGLEGFGGGTWDAAATIFAVFVATERQTLGPSPEDLVSSASLELDV